MKRLEGVQVHAARNRAESAPPLSAALGRWANGHRGTANGTGWSLPAEPYVHALVPVAVTGPSLAKLSSPPGGVSEATFAAYRTILLEGVVFE